LRYSRDRTLLPTSLQSAAWRVPTYYYTAHSSAYANNYTRRPSPNIRRRIAVVRQQRPLLPRKQYRTNQTFYARGFFGEGERTPRLSVWTKRERRPSASFHQVRLSNKILYKTKHLPKCFLSLESTPRLAIQITSCTAAMACPFVPEIYHNVDSAMQQYLSLRTQHEELVQYLDLIRQPSRSSAWPSSYSSVSPSSTPSLSCSPTTSQSILTTSPTSRRSRTSGFAPPLSASAASNSSLDTVWDEDVLCEVEGEEQRLAGVNEGIKRALTELLNCQDVRKDRSLRMWVQCQLMQTEKELRSGRRKRSSY